MSLKGKNAVVTGGGKGIGRACALQLARDGAAVAIWDLDGASTEETVALIKQEGGKAIACVGDAASKAGVAQHLEKTHAELGPVTILVNNAGMTGFTPFMNITEEHWDKMMSVNIKGPFLCAQAIIPDMLAAGWGRIINISSSSAQTGAPAMAHYVTSKGGVMGFTKALAVEYADKGITVNNIPPGFIDTPMLRSSPVDVDKFTETTLMKRIGKPEDIAAGVSYLASEAGGYVTGHTLSVTGGRYFN